MGAPLLETLQEFHLFPASRPRASGPGRQPIIFPLGRVGCGVGRSGKGGLIGTGPSPGPPGEPIPPGCPGLKGAGKVNAMKDIKGEHFQHTELRELSLVLSRSIDTVSLDETVSLQYFFLVEWNKYYGRLVNLEPNGKTVKFQTSHYDREYEGSINSGHLRILIPNTRVGKMWMQNGSCIPLVSPLRLPYPLSAPLNPNSIPSR